MKNVFYQAFGTASFLVDRHVKAVGGDHVDLTVRNRWIVFTRFPFQDIKRS